MIKKIDWRVAPHPFSFTVIETINIIILLKLVKKNSLSRYAKTQVVRVFVTLSRIDENVTIETNDFMSSTTKLYYVH